MEETTKAYFAGLFDGEGCVIITKGMGKNSKTPFYTLQTRLQMCDLATVTEFHEAWGGSFHTVERDDGRRTEYRCYLSQTDSVNFLTSMLPYLITKKLEAKLALRFVRETKGVQGHTVEGLAEKREKYKNVLSFAKRAD